MTIITRDEWIAALEAIQQQRPSDEGMTRRELAEAMGISDVACGDRLRELHRRGRLWSGRATRKAIDGRMAQVPVYRLTP